jgi:predicted NodU family carbamoyl transferase
MNVLGISGFFNTNETTRFPNVSPAFFHDAAAALVTEGGSMAAAEQERFDRVKHSNAFPTQAIGACLDEAGVQFSEIDKIAFFFEEDFVDRELTRECLEDPSAKHASSRQMIQEALDAQFGHRTPDDHVVFVRHHEAHAASTFHQCPFGDALVCVIDGNGERQSLSLFDGNHGSMRLVREYSRPNSLGHFYTRLTQFLGFQRFDEYKVMGLAPYGDRSHFNAVFRSHFDLQEEGRYALDTDGCLEALERNGITPRNGREPLGTTHCNIAASLQAVLEEIVMHILRYAKHVTGKSALCLAGGVAQNSSMNGVIAVSGLFDKMFVHPAAHDAGAALGAALHVLVSDSARLSRVFSRPPSLRLSTPFLGANLGTDDQVEQQLKRWANFLEWSPCGDIVGATVAAIQEGHVVGWARGRAEFGPRALGHRSILADPRHAGNRDRINSAVKMREAFRPFAPSVVRERAAEFFELPPAETSLEYMGVVVPVRPQFRADLAAITHVDGTARVQLVDKTLDREFWHLLDEFGRETGFPILINTSFNNYAEPIVQTPTDAIRCFLASGLTRLVLGHTMVWKKQVPLEAWLELCASLTNTATATVELSRGDATRTVRVASYIGRGSGFTAKKLEISSRLFDILRGPPVSLRLALSGLSNPARSELVRELRMLWEARLVDLLPGDST